MKACALTAALAVMSVSVALADESEKVALEEEQQPIVSGEFSLEFHSQYVNYGFIDKEPLLRPCGSLTFCDLLTVGVFALFDVDGNGRRRGYTDRQWQYIEIHPFAALGYTLDPADIDWLPTKVSLELGYDYEYHARSKAKGPGWYGDPWDKSICSDTQFWTLTVSLPDLWIEPALYLEQDVVRDHGLYANLELGHTFALIGEGEDAVLTFRPSVAQGFGNRQRIAAYAQKYDPATGEYENYSHTALMDTSIKGELTWKVCEHLSLSGYVAYYDFLFDGGLRGCERDFARYYDHARGGNTSWDFIAGFGVVVDF